MTTSRDTGKTARIAAALLLFLFGSYVLGASGHTYSPDEESILYVARAFVTRGEFNIPNRNQAPVVGGKRGMNGKIYSGTGVLTSLLVSPLYVLGDAAARVLEPRARDFIVRVIGVTTFNALLAALCGVLFFAWNRRLEVSVRAALGVTFIAAFGTFFAIYARTLYAEILLALCWLLAAYGVRTFHDSRAARWMVLAGFASGLALLTKIQGVLALPALGLYFIFLEWTVSSGNFSDALKSFVRAAIKPALAFLVPFGLCIAFYAYYNVLRFGAPFETGYGAVDTAYPLWRGVYGMLGSSGKSVFLYAPPLVLSLFALPRFFNRHLPEAVLCVTLVATVIVFHARVSYWAGDGAWGPRYLTATLPFWILPLGAVLSDWWRNLYSRAVVIAFCALGIFVNLLGMGMNFDTYIQIEPREAVRHFEPQASPLLAQWTLLNERAGAWAHALQTRDGVFLARGFTDKQKLFPQYIPSRAQVWIKNSGDTVLHVYALDYRVETKPKRTLAFFINGIPADTARVPHDDAGELEYRVALPHASDITLEIVTLGTEPQGSSPQGDELGVHVQSLELKPVQSALPSDIAPVNDAQDALPLDAALAIPNAPFADARELWGWFFRPSYGHFDHVLWYLNFAGLENGHAIVMAAAWFVLGAASTAIGAFGLWRNTQVTA